MDGDRDDDQLPFVTLATAMANVLTYLRTRTNQGAPSLEENPNRKGEDAGAHASKREEGDDGQRVNRDLNEIGLVNGHDFAS